jgi:Skp family chaperone for outer membrane proteins
VSASAAFYSVSGLSKLFAGASFEVLVMASSLEVAKLVIASLLYQYWKELNKLLKIYLTIAALVLVLITSMGIYGFLSAAYQETANKAGTIDAQVALVEVKRDNVKQQLEIYNKEKVSINNSVTELRTGLSNNKIQYKDKDGNLITTTSTATRQALQSQLDQAIERQDKVNEKVDELNEELLQYETEIVEIQSNSELAGELGPLKYLSGLTGIPMDRIINYLLLVIIFVFDPLAISLVIAANFAFEKAKPRWNLYGEDEKEFEDWNHTDKEVWDILVKDEEEIKPKEKEVLIIEEEPELEKQPEKIEEDWTIVDEEGKELPEKKIIRILQKSPSRKRVLYSDGSTGWINREDENKIEYL